MNMRMLARMLLVLFACVAVGCRPPASTPPAAPQSAANGAQSATHELPAASQAAAGNSSGAAPSADVSAAEILKRLLATYRQARSYADEGVVRLAFRQSGQPVSQEWPVAVALARPNRLSLVAHQATVKCDGRELKARIQDPDSNHVDHQVVVRPAPKELKLSDLAADALLYDVLSSRLRRQPIQLELLIESGGLVSAFAGDVACQRLEDGQHAGETCYRVAVPSPGGDFVFWIDPRQFLLRRLDYPAAALVPDLANDPTVSDLSLTADLRGAQLNPVLPDERFALELPPGAKRMKTFVVPPQPLASDLFGRAPEGWSFTTAAGPALGKAELAGQIVVLAWFHDHPACEATLREVARAAERLKGQRGVRFLAVATDPTTTSTAQLEERLKAWQAELPLVRDLAAHGDRIFHIALQPTIVVLDRAGRVQIFQTGGNPQLADQLVTIVDRLLEGDDLAAGILGRQQREQQQYADLVARGGPEPGEVLELPEAVIHRATQPRTLGLRPLWKSTAVKSPGNLLWVEEESAPPRLITFEGWRVIAEIGPEGQVAARHDLNLPEAAAVTFARAVGSKGGQRYFVLGAPLSPQLYVFDGAWRPLAAFPQPDQPPLSLVDLAWADVDEDGTPEVLAASVADVGVVALGVDGQVRWRNRKFSNSLSLAVTPRSDVGTWGILVTGESGEVLRLNRFGRDEPPTKVGQWLMQRLIAAPPASAAGGEAPAGAAAFLGLAANPQGQPTAVGLSSELKELWNYPLPAGAHQKPIEPVAFSRLAPQSPGEWWLAGPDGSLHVIRADGQWFDSFYSGAAIAGIAAGRLGDKPALVVATNDGLTAWEVTLPPPSTSQPAAAGAIER